MHSQYKKKSLLIILLICISAIFIHACQEKSDDITEIGIILPIEHKALDEIVAGFTETLQKSAAQRIKFKIYNAQGDLNLQQTMIQQMNNARFRLVVPIGTPATQMAMSLVKRKSILSLASVVSDQERNKQKFCHLSIVHDEIPPRTIIALIHNIYPQVHNITLVHSASDKVFPEVSKAIAAGQTYEIRITPLLVPSLNDLYSITNHLPKNTQAILILKDSLIASGVSTLVQKAHKLQLPLISADEGTVADGVDFSLGVHEREIGRSGAELAQQILAGKSPCELPVVEMDQVSVFINRNLTTHNADLSKRLTAFAKINHYPIETV